MGAARAQSKPLSFLSWQRRTHDGDDLSQVSWSSSVLCPAGSLPWRPCRTRSGPRGAKARPPSWPSDWGAAEQLLLTRSREAHRDESYWNLTGRFRRWLGAWRGGGVRRVGGAGGGGGVLHRSDGAGGLPLQAEQATLQTTRAAWAGLAAGPQAAPPG